MSIQASDPLRGTVHEAGGGSYRVALDDGRSVEATLRGRLKRQPRTGSRVVIGDRVEVREESGAWCIVSVEERRAELVRRGRGRRTPKVLAANLDHAFAVVAVREPPATHELIDRLLVLVEAGGMRPVLVLNKIDLEGGEDAARSLAGLYEGVGYRVLAVSAVTGAGLEPFRDALCRGISALIGPSGAGKSSLLNAIDPDLGLRIGALSRKTGTGRHTTVGSRLVPLACGGVVADTPGFADVGLWEVDPDVLTDHFPDLAAHAAACRFRGCAHVRERDCAVRAAVEEGQVAQSRYRSYVKLREETEVGRRRS